MTVRKLPKLPPPKFEVGDEYHIMTELGEGAYGIVMSARHIPSERLVAIKRIRPFEHPLMCLRTLRELKLLKFFSEDVVNENIVTILDIIQPPSLDQFNEIYLVQELMQTDLHRVIRTQTLSEDHCQYFIYQTLRALKTIHSADIVHRDLKPANLLLNANCDLKVCDFGLARSVKPTSLGGKEAGLMTEYVATRWYRAPEIMLSLQRYTKAVDMWSVGCILAELIRGRPLFPGRDYAHQLELILNVIGTPTLEEFYAITSRRSRDYIRSLPIRKRLHFGVLVPDASPDAIDFLSRTLTFDPDKRMTVDEALEHPFVSPYYDPSDELAVGHCEPSYFEFELHKQELSMTQLKELLYEEVISFMPSI